MTLARDISEHLKRQGYVWYRKGEPYTPTDSDIDRVLDDAFRTLYNESVDGVAPQYERGGIIVQKQGEGSFDVYVRIGEL